MRKARIRLATTLVNLAAKISPHGLEYPSWFQDHWESGDKIVSFGIARGYSMEQMFPGDLTEANALIDKWNSA